VDLIARGEIDPEPLISGIHPLTEAASVYERLHAGTLGGIGVLFEYPTADASESPQLLAISAPEGSTAVNAPASRVGQATKAGRAAHEGPVRVGFIGAGNYATSMLLPRLSRRDDVSLVGVATNRSLSAVNAQKKFGFATATTDVENMLSDEKVEAVFVVTRHSSHADLTCRALSAGKAVFVEKPLALTFAELEKIVETVDATGNDRLMVGFNRRFAPVLNEMRARFGKPAAATAARYLVNAGPLAPNSWYRNEELEGSRFVGEGGHFVDTVSWWVGSDPVEVSAVTGKDPQDVHVTLRYPDGTIATITYLTNGHPRFPKETFEVFSGGRSARLDNFKRGYVWTGRRRHVKRALASADKGQGAEIEAFLQFVRSDGPAPIPLSSLLASTRATLAVPRSLASGTPVRL
jgi:predicted dehydrogenase